MEVNAKWWRDKGYTKDSVSKTIREETVPVKTGNKLCYYMIKKNQDPLECVGGSTYDTLAISIAKSCIVEIETVTKSKYALCGGVCKKEPNPLPSSSAVHHT